MSTKSTPSVVAEEEEVVLAAYDIDLHNYSPGLVHQIEAIRAMPGRGGTAPAATRLV